MSPVLTSTVPSQPARTSIKRSAACSPATLSSLPPRCLWSCRSILHLAKFLATFSLFSKCSTASTAS